MVPKLTWGIIMCQVRCKEEYRDGMTMPGQGQCPSYLTDCKYIICWLHGIQINKQGSVRYEPISGWISNNYRWIVPNSS